MRIEDRGSRIEDRGQSILYPLSSILYPLSSPFIFPPDGLYECARFGRDWPKVVNTVTQLLKKIIQIRKEGHDESQGFYRRGACLRRNGRGRVECDARRRGRRRTHP